MAAIQNGDFVTIDYTATLEDGSVFDTTLPEIAAKNATRSRTGYKPVTVCVGEGMLVSGVDKALVGRELGEFTLSLPAEQAFGKKDPKLLRIVPTEQLKKQEIRPAPGMRLSIDGSYGVVIRTGGGRTVVDFNHPLAGHAVHYKVFARSIVTAPAEQIRALLEPLGLGTVQLHVEGKRATVTLEHLLPAAIMDALQQKIVKLTSITTVSFEAGKKTK